MAIQTHKPSLAESWQNLTLANNFLFCKIMENNPDLCKHLLELLLHIEIDHLETPVAERSIKETLDSKSVRFDVYTKDSTRIFDLEMQTVNKSNLQKRARYYQSIIDVDNLAQGTEYSNLRDAYVIFICLDDLFYKGLPMYFFENICMADGKTIKLDDRAYKVFFNASDCDKLESDEEKSFFKFLKGETASDEFTRTLESKISRAKENLDWRRQYMTWEQEMKYQRWEAYEEGLSEGVQQNARETAKNLLSLNKLTSEQIAHAVSLPLEEVLALKDELATS